MAKYFHGDWDRSMKDGDLVTTSYYRGNKVYKIIKYTRRFYTEHDLRGSYSDKAKNEGVKEGDEYNPLVTIEVVYNPNGPVRREVRHLDIFYCAPWSPNKAAERLKKQTKKLLEMAKDLEQMTKLTKRKKR